METDFALPGISPQQQRIIKIFHPYAYAKMADALKLNARFVHYTSADAAVAIFQSKEFWMRKSSCMNDYMEIEHGFDCLRHAYKLNLEKLQTTFDGIFPGFCKKLEELFDGWLPHFRTDTFIACISEHDDKEDTIGRLSSWRAYGNGAGVAIVLKPSPFFTPTDALKAYASPVAYLDNKAFENEFSRLISEIQANLPFLESLGQDLVLAQLFGAFRWAILCTKHPGFREEREWRITYCPKYDQSKRLIASVQSINGTPQPIYKIPLKDVPEEGLVGIEIPKFIDRLIIGPTKYPFAIRDAFVSTLEKVGMEDAQKRVVVSDIPLRQ